jgi:hypothetical protein
MKWLRSNIKHGSRLALFALAVQLVLSFGHFHGVAAKTAPGIRSSVAQFRSAEAGGPVVAHSARQAARQQPSSDHDSDHRSHDPCAICAVMAMANAVLLSTPPLLLLPQAIEFLYLTTDAEFIHLSAIRVAFQPRAPPAS